MFGEQEVANTLMAYAKVEHVDFALLEARPLARRLFIILYHPQTGIAVLPVDPSLESDG